MRSLWGMTQTVAVHYTFPSDTYNTGQQQENLRHSSNATFGASDTHVKLLA